LIEKILYINVGENYIGKIKEKNMARVLISMPEKFLDEIDSVANNENRTRSELIREALRTYMYRNQLRNSQKSVSNAELLDSLLG
jgi:metal-responsive CopG/Arc/MetJ family transcriptional regulator